MIRNERREGQVETFYETRGKSRITEKTAVRHTRDTDPVSFSHNLSYYLTLYAAPPRELLRILQLTQIPKGAGEDTERPAKIPGRHARRQREQART
jgi:hypothetical protein